MIFLLVLILKNQDSVEFLVEIYALHNLTYDLPYHLRLWLIFFTSWKFSANDFRSSIQFVYLQKKTQKNYKNKKMKPAFVRILTVSVLFIIISQGA